MIYCVVYVEIDPTASGYEHDTFVPVLWSNDSTSYEEAKESIVKGAFNSVKAKMRRLAPDPSTLEYVASESLEHKGRITLDVLDGGELVYRYVYVIMPVNPDKVKEKAKK